MQYLLMSTDVIQAIAFGAQTTLLVVVGVGADALVGMDDLEVLAVGIGRVLRLVVRDLVGFLLLGQSGLLLAEDGHGECMRIKVLALRQERRGEGGRWRGTRGGEGGGTGEQKTTGRWRQKSSSRKRRRSKRARQGRPCHRARERGRPREVSRALARVG